MTEINQEVHNIDNDQANQMSTLTKDCLDKLHIDQKSCKRKHNSSEEDIDSRSPESQVDRDSGFENISSVESSNSDVTSDEFQYMSTASPLKQNESQYHENKLLFEQKTCKRKHNSSEEDSNVKSPGSQVDRDSGFENISSVESSNPERVLTSSDEFQCMSTASPLKQDKRPYNESPDTPCSEQSGSPNVSLSQAQNEEEGNYNQVTNILETNDTVDECRKDIKSRNYAQRRELDIACEQKNLLQGNWKYLKKNIDLSMFRAFVSAGLATMEDDPKYIRSEKRSKKADMLVMRVIQRVENNNDLRKFESVVGQAVWKKLGVRQLNPYEKKVSEQYKNYSRLSSNHDVMIKHLRSDDLEMIKDWFVEEFIISMKENDKITNHPGFCEVENDEFTEYFVNEFIIKKSVCGSYQCLLECLEKKVGTKFTRLRRLLDSLKKDDVTKTDAGIKAPVVSLQVVKTSSPEMKQERFDGISTKDCKMRFKFENDNEHTQKVYDEVMIKAKTKNGQIRNDIGGCIGKITPGSVVIHMVALDRDMIQNIIDKIRTGQLSNVVNLLFSDVQIKRCLPVGKNELEVTCFVADKQNILTHKTCGFSHQLNPIADNKSFIEEEMDTLYVLTELEKHDVHINIDIHDGDRELRARHIMKKALSDEKISNMLHQVLLEGKTTNVKERLRRYEKVYQSDSSQLEKNICRHFNEIITKVFLDDIRLVFTERNIIKDEIFDQANEQSQEKNEIAMAHILTEIILYGTDAMLTLVDALYVVQFDKLADKLMTRDDQVDGQVQKKMNREFVHHTKQANRTTSDEIPLAIGKYELIVRKRRRPNKKISGATKRSTSMLCTRKRKSAPLDYVTQHDIYDNGFRCSVGYWYQDKAMPGSVLAYCYQYQHPHYYGMKYPVDKRFAAIQTLEANRYIDDMLSSTFWNPSIIDIVRIYWNNDANRYIDDKLSSTFWNASISDIVRKYLNNEANRYIDDKVSSTFWNASISDIVRKNWNNETNRYIDDQLSSSFGNISIIDIVRKYWNNEANRYIDDKLSRTFWNARISDIVRKNWNNDANTYTCDKLSCSFWNASISDIVRIYLNNDEKEMDVERLGDIDDIIKRDLSGSPSDTS